jgi:hypothetical protein
MRHALVLLALLAPLPAGALGLQDLEGRWQGEGALVLADEPAQRLRCQLRLSAAGDRGMFFAGRCATSQGAQSFHYRLSEPQPGQVLAENLSDPPDALPPRMQGRSDAQGVQFQAEGGASFELARDGDGLRLIIAGHDRRGPARGEARLTLRE